MRAAVKTLALAALVAGLVHADAANFVAGTWSPVPTGFSAHNTNVYARDLTLVVISNFALYGVNTPNSYALPPKTNEWVILGTGGYWSSYVDIAAGELGSSVGPGVVGSKNGLTGGSPAANGEFLFAVGGNSGKKGYCRAFSTTNVTGAAYYMNSSLLWPLEAGAEFRSIGADMVVSNINPAYAIPFVVTPMTSANPSIVTGQVNASSAGGNNQLVSGSLLIEWRYESGSAWVADEMTNLYATGGFSFEPRVLVGPTNLMVRARVKDDYTTRAGFPISLEYLVTVTPQFSIAITNPASSPVITTNTRMTLAGTALNVSNVGWYTSLGSNGLAVGTVAWIASNVPIVAATNTITVWGAAGSKTTTASVVVYRDVTLPVVSAAAVSPGTTTIGRVSALISFSKSMNGAVAVVARYLPDGTAFAGGYRDATSWTGTAAVVAGNDGLKTLSVSNAMDAAGLMLTPTNNVAVFFVDTVAPSNISLTINNGMVYTNSSNVSVTLHAEDSLPLQMIVANNQTFIGANWTPYATSTNWTLSAGSGPRWVFARFIDLASNMTAVISNSIVVDTLGPNGTLAVNGGAFFTTNQFVTLTLYATDLYLNVTDMRISQNTGFVGAVWQRYATTTNWALSGGQGTNNLYAEFRDTLFNVGTLAQTSVVLDTTLPIVQSAVVVPNPAKIGAVTVTVTFADALAGMDTAVLPDVRFATLGNRTGVYAQLSYIGNVWRGLGTVLAGDDGTAYVDVRSAKDKAGNIMTAALHVATFDIDTLPPSNTLLLVNNGAAFTSNRTVLVTNVTFGATAVDLANDAGFTNAVVTNYLASYDWTLLDADGTNTVNIRYRDAALNSYTTNAAIILDRVAPTSPALMINGGAATTTNPAVTLALSALDPYLSSMMIANNETFSGAQWTQYMATIQWNLPTNFGVRTVFAKFRDQVGLVSSVASNSIVLVPEPALLLGVLALLALRARKR